MTATFRRHPDGRLRRFVPALPAIVAVILAGCGGGETTATPLVSTTVTATTKPTTTAEPSAGVEAWLGRFQWTEFAPGDPGSDQTIVHDLILTEQAIDGSLSGTFTQTGFQTDVSLEVVAYPGETGVTIVAAADRLPLYRADQRLFALSGDPDAPTTALAAVQPLLTASVPAMGEYFTR